MLFEDLGDLSLYSWLRCCRSHEAVETMYRKVLDQLIRLHGGATEQVGDCPLLAERVFDYDYLRWETAYFWIALSSACSTTTIMTGTLSMLNSIALLLRSIRLPEPSSTATASRRM